MQEYQTLLRDVTEKGLSKGDRTGTGTSAVFGRQIRFDLSKGFPLLTTKKVHTRAIIKELLWFIEGNTNVRDLQEDDVKIWDQWRQSYDAPRKLVPVQPKAAALILFQGTGNPCFRKDESPEDKNLRDLWKALAENGRVPGITLHPEWHDPDKFVEGVKKLPHYEYFHKNPEKFILDPWYYDAAEYGPETAVWSSLQEAEWNSKKDESYVLSGPGFEQEHFISTDHLKHVTGINSLGIAMLLSANPLSDEKWKGKSLSRFRPQIQGTLVRQELIPDGSLGPIYGKMWRDWDGVDQLQNLVNDLRNNPTSRRLIIAAWHPTHLPKMALPPCHCLFQFYCEELTFEERLAARKDKSSNKGGPVDLALNQPKDELWHEAADKEGYPKYRLSCQLYQRSADIFLGVPFNIASYALLTQMLAQVTNMVVGEFIHTFGDLHLYDNHKEQAQLQLSRDPRPLPTMTLNPDVKEITDFTMEDFTLTGYDPHPVIKAKVAV